MRKLAFFLALATAASMFAAVPRVVAHRGYHRAEGSAQNSIRALVKADSIGAYGSEFDVWLSADNKLYVNHNRDINGIVIETSTSEAIDTCHLSNGELIPTLDAYLDAGKDLKTMLVLELKPHADTAREDVAIPMILKAVADRGLEDRMIYITFSRNAFDKFAAATTRPVQFLTSVAPEEIAAAAAKARAPLGADYNLSAFRKNPQWITDFQSAGRDVNVWTVDKPEDLQWCIEHGVDFITTNEPELTAKLISEHQK